MLFRSSSPTCPFNAVCSRREDLDKSENAHYGTVLDENRLVVPPDIVSRLLILGVFIGPHSIVVSTGWRVLRRPCRKPSGATLKLKLEVPESSTQHTSVCLILHSNNAICLIQQQPLDLSNNLGPVYLALALVRQAY